MADWVWVFPSEAVIGDMVAGRKIIVVMDRKEMRVKALCKKTFRQLWPGIYQLVRIE
ncbi:MAG: hypothetical protein K2X80_03635 [Pseudomonadaceae bacterium]|nr:hypothetical protein [Pseudomonadaceae bacterium]